MNAIEIKGKVNTALCYATIVDKAVPNVVGVDIGCGMYTVNLGKQKIDLEKFDMTAFTIPSGRDFIREDRSYSR